MSVKERDPLTGHQTTGHEWDGITELNTRVPPAVWWAIGITHVWALVVWVLLPTWPLVTTYTRGILGVDQQEQVESQVFAAQAARADWVGRIEAMSIDEIHADPDLMARVDDTAPALFGDNCAGCHGADAAGGPGFPSLVDADWIWGGDADTIMETLRVGVNSQHPETRYAEMPAFGSDEILSRDEIRVVADYVQSLSGAEVSADRLDAGAEIFANNCASCHGDEAAGDAELGAPDLTDGVWIYGGDDAALFQTIWAGRQGWMPAREDRLSVAERKMMTVHLTQLAAEAAE